MHTPVWVFRGTLYTACPKTRGKHILGKREWAVAPLLTNVGIPFTQGPACFTFSHSREVCRVLTTTSDVVCNTGKRGSGPPSLTHHWGTACLGSLAFFSRFLFMRCADKEALGRSCAICLGRTGGGGGRNDPPPSIADPSLRTQPLRKEHHRDDHTGPRTPSLSPARNPKHTAQEAISPPGPPENTAQGSPLWGGVQPRAACFAPLWRYQLRHPLAAGRSARCQGCLELCWRLGWVTQIPDTRHPRKTPVGREDRVHRWSPTPMVSGSIPMTRRFFSAGARSIATASAHSE